MLPCQRPWNMDPLGPPPSLPQMLQFYVLRPIAVDSPSMLTEELEVASCTDKAAPALYAEELASANHFVLKCSLGTEVSVLLFC